MTYSELYSKATTWAARHIAQDLILMYGCEGQASVEDIETVSSWQVEEGGEEIAPSSSRGL
jgi:hypothetical protein